MNREEFRAAVRGTVIPAVPVPFDENGNLHEAAQRDYAQALCSLDIGGVSVWAHTGRGLHISENVREKVLKCWAEAVGPAMVVIAGAGSSLGPEAQPDEIISDAVSMARHARELGADAVMAYAPAAFRGRPDERELVVRYHARIAEAGLPVVLFYLYEEAGGISYTADELRELLSMPSVVGIKLATLDSVMTYQDVATLVKREFPDVVLISGEDRFLGYSLMAGAEAALVGMGSALTQMQIDLLAAHSRGEWAEFARLSELVDEFARHTFKSPMEGYIRRMLWAAEAEGIMASDAAYDRYGPELTDQDHDQVRQATSSLLARLK